MDDARELRFALLAVREGLLDADRLAAAAHEWPAGSPFLDYLIDRGWVTPEQRKRLEAAAAGSPTSDLRPDLVTADGPEPFATTHGPVGSAHLWQPPADRYRVIELYRSGGLGRVWRAEDTALGRTVALKTLRPDRAVDPRLQSRFIEEARITGRLEHPCVVPVYDLLADGAAGTAGPSYTMRFVAGRTLAEAARDYHERRAAGTAARLDLAALLDAFVAVCRAVAYAHARNILHRDLKGQNIVLGEYGEVFVLDWGLAKVLGGADSPAVTTPVPAGPREETVSGAVLGTPAFMAPELAAGSSAAVATDVYALGVVLYVILAGRPPYEGSGVRDVLDQIEAGPPPPPKALAAGVPPDLEAICLKAMARDPSGRYRSADALAADVRSWLADEPVGAYPEPWPARLARWARHHRPAVLAAAGALLTAVIGLAVTTVLVLREERRTAEQRDQAEMRQALARDVSSALRRLTEKWLSDVGQGDQTRRDLLAGALVAYRRALEKQPDDVELQTETARLARILANLYRLTGNTAEAEERYREAVRLYEALAAATPDNPVAKNLLAETLRDQSQLLVKLGRHRDAAAALERSIATAEALSKSVPDSADYRRTLATALLDRAETEHHHGRYAAAEATAGRAADLFRELRAGPAGDAHEYDHMFLAAALDRRAAALREQGQVDAALAGHTAAFKEFQSIFARGGDRNEQHFLARAHVERGRTNLLRPDRHARAERDFTMAIAAWDELRKAKKTAYLREWQAEAYLGRGEARRALGRTADAAADVNEARTLAEALVAEDATVPSYHAVLGEVYAALGRQAAAAGDKPAAADWFAKAVAALRAARERDPDCAPAGRALAEVEAARARLSGTPPD